MKKKIFAFAFVLLAISIFTLNSFALAPPTITSNLPITSTSALDADSANRVFSLVIYQKQSGSFNDLKPLHLRRSSSTGQFILVCSHPDVSYYYTNVNGTLTSNTSQTQSKLVELKLTSEGFALATNGPTPQTTLGSTITIGYVSDAYGTWTFNESYVFGSSSGFAVAPYDLWSNYYWTLTQYEYNVEQAEQVGYQNGYTAGELAGHTAGYQAGVEYGQMMGYGDGYNAGIQDGYEDGYEVGYEDGVASVPPGSGSDRVVTAYVTFANGEVPSPGGDNVVLVKNGSFRFLGSDDLWSLLNDGYSIYSIDYDILASQLSSGSSIRFKIPDALQQAFPAFNWPVVVVTDSRPESAELRVYLYRDSYEAGYQSGLQDGDLILNGIADIATAPVAGLKSALDFEIFGVNVGAVAIGCVAVALILIAWRFIRKLLPI